MLSAEAHQELEKQGYRIIGSHSAVKTCGWTKKMIRGEGGCYKLKFYGIMSNQCLQMTTSISCANRCIFCWRGYKAPVSTDWKWGVDDPVDIIDGAEKSHHDLLMGFNGNPNANRKAYLESKKVKHVALSLTGEPIVYPRINDAIGEFHRRGISTFMVTNAQYADQIRDMHPVTQLYLSIDAPNKELLKKIDKPLFKDYWERMLKSLAHLATRKERTCIRLTMLKHLNMTDLDGYAELIKRGDPDFIEAKGYMFVGASRERLEHRNMPLHEEVLSFCKHLLKLLPDYEMVSEHIMSRAVMLAKRKFKKDGKWNTWIDFDRFNGLVDSSKTFSAEDYLRLTPSNMLGISGKGTLDNMQEAQRKKVLAMLKEDGFGVDEITDELEFWQENGSPGDC